MVRYAAVLLLLSATQSYALTYSEWLTASEQWKRGYVFGYAEYAKTFAADEVGRRWAEGYGKCFGTITDMALLKIVEDHLDKNSTLKAEHMMVGVNSALRELCANYLPKPKR